LAEFYERSPEPKLAVDRSSSIVTAKREGRTVSESSDTEQNSIVFMGRKSFRMQIVGEGAIPQASWETPTERMIERRKSDDRRVGGQRDRRKLVRGSEVAELPVLSDAPALAAQADDIERLTTVEELQGHGRAVTIRVRG